MWSKAITKTLAGTLGWGDRGRAIRPPKALPSQACPCWPDRHGIGRCGLRASACRDATAVLRRGSRARAMLGPMDQQVLDRRQPLPHGVDAKPWRCTVVLAAWLQSK